MIPRIRQETTPIKRAWTVRCPECRRYVGVGGYYDSRHIAQAIWDQHVREVHR